MCMQVFPKLGINTITDALCLIITVSVVKNVLTVFLCMHQPTMHGIKIHDLVLTYCKLGNFTVKVFCQ